MQLLFCWFLVFCGYDNDVGPHTLVCLTGFWLAAGCSETGERAPANADDTQLAIWHSWTVLSVRNDMALYKQFALDGQQEYITFCFGYM